MSPRIALFGALGVLFASAAATAEAAPLQTASGLRMELSPSGRVTGLQIGPTTLTLRGTGGLALADFQDQPQPANLVPNPGFEAGVAGWHLDKYQSLDTQVAHAGHASARLTVPPGVPRSTSLEVRVPVKPNTRYRVGMWLRRQQAGVCGAYSSERDDRNQLTGKQTQVGTTIPKQDGVWLPLSWEITTEPRTTRLSLRADIYRSTGTVWLDDYFVEELSEGVYDPVEGTVTPLADGVQLKASLPRRRLDLEAQFRPGPLCLRVDGQVRDTTGKDRAVGLRFALPLDLDGWTWHHDAEERETIHDGPVSRLTYKCRTGVGVCSIYPWSAASGPNAGFSLGVPLAQGPRVFVLQHDQRRPETSLTFYFGLTRDAGQNPSRATFSFVVYPHDPAWGMRAAMQTYYRLFPESFVKRPTFEGYLNYADMERFDPARHQLLVNFRDALDDAGDFGEGYKFLWHMHGCYDYRQVACQDPKLPADRVVFGLLDAMVESEKSKPKWYTPTADTIRKICFGPERQISYIGDTKYWRPHEGYNHTDQAGWGFNFRVNEDPGVSPFLARLARTKAEQYARQPGVRPWDATFTADAIEGYMANAGGPDYRREHFRTTSLPLSFGYDNRKPCMPNTIWDFHHKAWRPITDQYKIATYGNANGYELFFTMPYIDVPMTEFDWDSQHPARLDRFLRAVAYRKIWRHWHAWNKAGRYADQDPASVEAHFRRALAYAVYPAVACVQSATGDLEPHRALYRQYVPAIEELSTAGWDPVPYATATEGVIVERFGTYAQGELHFTLRNYADRPVATRFVLDRKALGIAADAELLLLDILPRAPRLCPLPREACPVALDADGTRALWIGTRKQAAQHAFRLARATLEKTERLFAGDFGGVSLALWNQALEKSRAGAAADAAKALELAEDLQHLAARLDTELSTRAPVDLAKLLLRLRAEVSLVPAALLNLEVAAPRVVADAMRGETSRVRWTLSMADARTRIVSPWGEVAEKSRVQPAPGDAKCLDADLAIPASPPRRLMPFLLEACGKIDGRPFTLATPVDVQVGPPLELKLLPADVLRGRQCKLTLSVANRSAAQGRLTIAIRPPAKVQIEPAKLSFPVDGRGRVERELTLTLDRNVPIGDLRLAYTVTSDDPRFAQQGPLFLLVADPAP
jgi:hypothetical protein